MKKEILESIGTILAIILAYLLKEVIIWLKDKWKEKQKPLNMVKRNKLSLQIDSVLHDIAKYYNADRCYLLSYHNSIKSHIGICHDFVSMVNEYHEPHLQPMLNDFQSIPTGQFSKLIDDLNNHEYVYVPEMEDSNVGGLHRAFGFKDSYKIKVGNSVANGSISLVFMKDMPKMNDADLQYYKDKTVLIHTLLMKKK